MSRAGGLQCNYQKLGGSGYLEAALSFVSCGLSRVVRGGHRPSRLHHGVEESEHSQPCDPCKRIYLSLYIQTVSDDRQLLFTSVLHLILKCFDIYRCVPHIYKYTHIHTCTSPTYVIEQEQYFWFRPASQRFYHMFFFKTYNCFFWNGPECLKWGGIKRALSCWNSCHCIVKWSSLPDPGITAWNSV